MNQQCAACNQAITPGQIWTTTRAIGTGRVALRRWHYTCYLDRNPQAAP